MSGVNNLELAPPEVDVGGRQVADALVISQVIVVGDEGRDLGIETARAALLLAGPINVSPCVQMPYDCQKPQLP